MSSTSPEQPWQDSPPTEAGWWEMKSAETDCLPERVLLEQKPDGLWVRDPYIGCYPLDLYHYNLIHIRWRKSCLTMEGVLG